MSSQWCECCERAARELAAEREAREKAESVLREIAERGCQALTILHLFPGPCGCPPCVAAVALGRNPSMGTWKEQP